MHGHIQQRISQSRQRRLHTRHGTRPLKAAKDAKGRPISDFYTTRVNWRLPEDDGTFYMPPAPHLAITSFFINVDGSTTGCIATVNGKPVETDGPCDDVLGYRYPIQKDAAGNPVRQKMRITYGIEKID